jgi:hypothetical protein
VVQIAKMREVVDLMKLLGRQPTKESMVAINEAEAKLARLKVKIGERENGIFENPYSRRSPIERMRDGKSGYGGDVSGATKRIGGQ